jgi:hypothetical protein
MHTCKGKTRTRCHASPIGDGDGPAISVTDEWAQPFPSDFRLDTSLEELRSLVVTSSAKAYSYVLTTVVFDERRTAFQQTGSGPNFQGGRLTLCTCKHQMRCGLPLPLKNWKETWIVGFTSRRECDYNWLFYVTQVDATYPSHNALWQARPELRSAKSSRRNHKGDLYEPKGALACTDCLNPDCPTCLDPDAYYPPMVGHSHRKTAADETWIGDIDTTYYNRRPALLVGKPSRTFLWEHPTIRFRTDHPRTKTWTSMAALLRQLL